MSAKDLELHELAEAAYLAHCRRMGAEPVEWEALRAKERGAWQAVAVAVRKIVLENREIEGMRPCAGWELAHG